MKRGKVTAEIAEIAEKIRVRFPVDDVRIVKRPEKMILCVLCVLCGCFPARAQDAAAPRVTRLAVLQAEDRRAPTARDLAVIRSGIRSGDDQTARIAVRALGRLERPALVADLLPSLRSALPEIRAEAANAIAQATQGWKPDRPPSAAAVDAVFTPLAARLKIEAEPDVRAAICESLGRLPYPTAAQVAAAERTLVEAGSRAETVTDRLGVAKGLEASVRLQRALRAPGSDALALLERFAVPGGNDVAIGARVRRLALEALVSAAAITTNVLGAASHDPDPQVRRIAMRAAAPQAALAASPDAIHAALAFGRVDDSPIVRLEALRVLRLRADADACAAALAASADRNIHVALFALDELAPCGASADAVAALEKTLTDLSDAASPRGWHRAAHALVALAAAAPDRGSAALPQFTGSRVWQLRMYAARAAALVGDRASLERLAKDEDDNVCEAAVEELHKIAGHDADAIYAADVGRTGNQIIRASALALADTPNRDAAVPPLEAALRRLMAEGRDNSHDARAAIEKALASVGADPPSRRTRARGPASGSEGSASANGSTASNDLNADDLRRLASPRARVTIRGVGAFELALFTSQAPATVLRFARLAEAGYYNGLTFHRVVPSFVIQGGSPGANEYVGDASFMRDEVGAWPHVRGAVGISTRGHDTGDAQIFVDLVDNPRLDHVYTVFAQVLNGIDVVDQVLEGDVIESIAIVTS